LKKRSKLFGSNNKKIIRVVETAETSSDLKRFIEACGGLRTAAVRLNVYPTVLKKILDNRPISLVLKRKIENAAKILPPFRPTDAELKSMLRDVIEKCGSVRTIATRMGTSIDSLSRVLEGRSVSPSVSLRIEIGLATYLESNRWIGKSNSPNAPTEDSFSVSEKNLRPSMVEKLRLAFTLYKELGTLEAVGKRMGVTRERVRQLLVKGSALSLYEYRPYNYPYVPKEKLIQDCIKLLSLGFVARVNNISTEYLKKLMAAYSITEKDFYTYRQEGKRKRCIEQYGRIKGKLGHHPTTTELQKTREGHALNARIIRLWGTFDAFREALNIPKPARISPYWLEPRLQLAFIARMQHLDTIRERLSALRPMSVSEISMECGFNLNRVRRLLKLLIAAGEVQKVGETTATKYQLAAD
jgi:transcriptional regulator with XRE-family HTH domain